MTRSSHLSNLLRSWDLSSFYFWKEILLCNLCTSLADLPFQILYSTLQQRGEQMQMVGFIRVSDFILFRQEHKRTFTWTIVMIMVIWNSWGVEHECVPNALVGARPQHPIIAKPSEMMFVNVQASQSIMARCVMTPPVFVFFGRAINQGERARRLKQYETQIIFQRLLEYLKKQFHFSGNWGKGCETQMRKLWIRPIMGRWRGSYNDLWGEEMYYNCAHVYLE